MKILKNFTPNIGVLISNKNKNVLLFSSVRSKFVDFKFTFESSTLRKKQNKTLRLQSFCLKHSILLIFSINWRIDLSTPKWYNFTKTYMADFVMHVLLWEIGTWAKWIVKDMRKSDFRCCESYFFTERVSSDNTMLRYYLKPAVNRQPGFRWEDT